MFIINILNYFGLYLNEAILFKCLSIILPFLTVVLGYKFFALLIRRLNIGFQPIRDDGPASHINEKNNVLTLGGILIFLAILFTALVVYEVFNPLLTGLVLIYIAHMLLGFYDDLMKLLKQNSKGLRGRYKLLFQFVFALMIVYGLNHYYPSDFDSTLIIPITDMGYDIGFYYFLFAAIVIVATSNAVNLTDGLDGLASFTTIPVLIFFVVILNFTESSHLFFFGEEYLENLKSLENIILIVIGALLGFLWWNAYPAKIFMGDVGSLPLGAMIGYLAVVTKSELLLLILGAVFVMEAISVILQVYYFKLTKKRLFKMAPIHHHFEISGVKENVVVSRFFISSIVLSVFSLTLVFA